MSTKFQMISNAGMGCRQLRAERVFVFCRTRRCRVTVPLFKPPTKVPGRGCTSDNVRTVITQARSNLTAYIMIRVVSFFEGGFLRQSNPVFGDSSRVFVF